MKARLPWEIKADVRYTKMAIIQLIDDTFAKEDPANDELWQRKVEEIESTFLLMARLRSCTRANVLPITTLAETYMEEPTEGS